MLPITLIHNILVNTFIHRVFKISQINQTSNKVLDKNQSLTYVKNIYDINAQEMFHITGNGGLVVVHCTILTDRVGYTVRFNTV